MDRAHTFQSLIALHKHPQTLSLQILLSLYFYRNDSFLILHQEIYFTT